MTCVVSPVKPFFKPKDVFRLQPSRREIDHSELVCSLLIYVLPPIFRYRRVNLCFSVFWKAILEKKITVRRIIAMVFQSQLVPILPPQIHMPVVVSCKFFHAQNTLSSD